MLHAKITEKISELQNNFSSIQLRSSTIFQTLKSLKFILMEQALFRLLCSMRTQPSSSATLKKNKVGKFAQLDNSE